MRIISGKYGGLSLVSTAKSTHPMSEKVRGAIFNSLGSLDGLRVLDVFAGTGALGFEALSRGASSVTAIESNKMAQNDITNNKTKVGVGSAYRLVKAKVQTWAQDNYEKFNVILCDPPYDNPQVGVLNDLARFLSGGGLLILSLPPKVETPEVEGLNFDGRKNYGDASLVFYKNNQ